jgi:enoyl-CoA hydratase/carnithine racemase
MTPLILLVRDGPLAILTLNRPARHNSLTPELLEELLAAIENLDADTTVRAVLLQAEGRSFSTGGDLLGFADHLANAETYAETLVGLLNRVILALVDLPVPVVIAIQGPVTGGAMGFVLAADVVLVSPGASFTPYYSAVGFSPDGGWTALLPQVIGPKRTAQVLYCNQTISPSQAVEWGLASRIVPSEELRTEARRVCREVAEGHPGSQRRTRALLRPPDVASQLIKEMEHFVAQIGAADTQERMQNFLNRM